MQICTPFSCFKPLQIVTVSFLRREVAFVFLARASEQPVCRHVEILYQRNDPSDFKVALYAVVALRVPVAAVDAVTLAIAVHAAWQAFRVRQLLHYVKVAFLHVKRGRQIYPRPTHCPQLCRTGHPKPVGGVLFPRTVNCTSNACQAQQRGLNGLL